MRDLKRPARKGKMNYLPGQDFEHPHHMMNLYPGGGTLQAILSLENESGYPDMGLGPGSFGLLNRAGHP